MEITNRVDSKWASEDWILAVTAVQSDERYISGYTGQKTPKNNQPNEIDKTGPTIHEKNQGTLIVLVQ